MKYRLIVRDRATQDLRSQANYLLTHHSSESASRFLEAAEATFNQIAKTPRIGRVVQLASARFGEVRRWRIKSFADYLVFYVVKEAEVEIFRILHGAMDLVLKSEDNPAVL